VLYDSGFGFSSIGGMYFVSDLLENGVDWTQWMGFEFLSVLLDEYFLFPLGIMDFYIFFLLLVDHFRVVSADCMMELM
jgi:hypothetical protein